MRVVTVSPSVDRQAEGSARPELGFATEPRPCAGVGELLLDVAGAGVNPADLLQVRGLYPPPPGVPAWPGLEVSGRVVEVGPDVEGWAVGDDVVALLAGGGYAEQVAVPATQALPAPTGVDLVDAAALPEAVCTAWSNLVDVGRLAEGDTVLVHGGSGGVGHVAVQLALALGARVVTTAGGPDRVARVAALAPDTTRSGALVVVDHRSEDFVERVRAVTDGRGADVVLDVVGAAYLGRNVEVLTTGGRLVVIGLQKGRRAELDLGTLLSRRASVHGTTLRSRPVAEKAAIVAAVREHVWPLVADGSVRAVVHARVPFADAARAHALLAEGGVFGKVVLDVAGGDLSAGAARS